MLKNIEIIINVNNDKDRMKFEAEIGVLEGVEDVNFSTAQENMAVIEFNEKIVSREKILEKIKEKGFKVKNETSNEEIKEIEYHVNGMHCSSCEILIEKKLLTNENIKAVEVSTNKNRALIEYVGDRPSVNRLNKKFKEDGYIFSEKTIKEKKKKLFEYNKEGQLLIDKERLNNLLFVLSFSFLFIIGFIYIHKSGLSALISVNSATALPMFIVFGLLAGFSSCAALVGGIILSMSKQWLNNYSNNSSTLTKLQPHMLFNAGRLLSYALLGVVLGMIGNVLQLSLTFTSALVLGVSIMMVFLGLQMLGVKGFQKFQITMPKFITRKIADESNFQGKYMPFIMGALTFFLPCGFTITAQGLALTSGSPVQAGLIMFFFALGTMPALLAIGLSSVTLTKSHKGSARFMQIAGVLVLFFAIFNVNSQLNVLGMKSLTDISLFSESPVANADSDLPSVINGKQVLEMDALAYGYEPNYFKVKVGVPVRWEISDKGTSGCTNAVMSKGLFEGQVALTPGKTSVKEFTPTKTGRYKFSCWMGMISGTIDVVDENDDGSVKPADNTLEEIPSGASGCGCGGGGSGSCGG